MYGRRTIFDEEEGPPRSYSERKKDLVESLQESNILHDPRIERAFLMVPLEEFIDDAIRVDEKLYLDMPQVFYARSQVDIRTISAPHMITICMEYLNLRSTDTLLFLGSKSGYMEAIASLLCSEGHVYVVEGSEEVMELTRANLKKTGFGENVSLIHGNPLTMAGTESLGTWDKILIPYQVEEPDVYPALRQLNDSGVLFAPIGDKDMQYFTQIIKNDGTYYGNRISTVIFSPLEKNVTYLSQQVQFLELVKKINTEVDVSTNIDVKLKNAKAALKARKLQAMKDPVSIIYDSEIGDQLCEKYRQETMVGNREESPDFKIIEAFAVEIATKHRGSVRVMTLLNEMDMIDMKLSFETLKLYLKRSTAGKLIGDMNDARTLKFELKEALAQKDPIAANMIEDLTLQFDTLESLSLSNEDTMPEFKDMLQYFIDKLEFLEQERNLPVYRSAALIVKQLLDHVNMLEAAREEQGNDWQAARSRIENAIRDGVKDLRSAVQRF